MVECYLILRLLGYYRSLKYFEIKGNYFYNHRKELKFKLKKADRKQFENLKICLMNLV